MTTAAQFQTKVTKAGVNMDRLDLIINGDDETVVETDSGEVPSIQKLFKDGFVVGLNRGYWDAAANDPAITAGEGTEGDFYTVSVSGTRAIADGDPVEWGVGDTALFQGGAWTRLPALASAGGRNRGYWDADTNTPEIVAGEGLPGDFYTVEVGGTIGIEDPGEPITWKAGDQVLFKDGAWSRIADSEIFADQALRAATQFALLDVVPKEFWAALQSPESSPEDMTPYILACAAERLPNGGTIRCEGLWITLQTQLVLPANIILYGGDKTPDEPETVSPNYRTTSGQILTNPALDEAIVMTATGSGVRGFTIQKTTNVTPLTSAEECLDWIAAMSKTAIKIDGQSGSSAFGCSVRNNLLLGYEKGVDCIDASRADVSFNNGHCNQLLSSVATFDLPIHEKNHNWPYCTVHLGFDLEPGVARTGTDNVAFQIGLADYSGALPHGGVDWAPAQRLFSFGANKGIVVEDSDNSTVIQSGVDAIYSSHAFAAGFNDVGLTYSGRIRRASLVDVMVSSQTYGILVDFLGDEYLEGGTPPVNGYTGGEVLHAVNLKIGASRYYSYFFESGNFTSIGGVSTIFIDPDLPTSRRHMALQSSFGRLDFIGTTFYNGVDVAAETLSDARDVGLYGCRFVNMTQRYFYNNQTQGAQYIRGQDGSIQSEAAVVIENRASPTGTATGQSWKLVVIDSGNLLIIDESDGAIVGNFTPAYGGLPREMLLAADLKINGYVGAKNRFYMEPVAGSFAFSLKDGAEPAGVAMVVASAGGSSVDSVSLYTSGVERVRADNIGFRWRNPYGSFVPVQDNFAGPDETSNSYTTALGDAGAVRRFTGAGAITIYLRNNARAGETFTAFQYNGQITFAAELGGSVVSLGGKTKSAGTYARVRCECVNNVGGAAAEWILSGDLTT